MDTHASSRTSRRVSMLGAHLMATPVVRMASWLARRAPAPRAHMRTVALAGDQVAQIVVAPEVQEALDQHAPVVALESTIITHGMPYPQNVETAKAVEDVVRAGGAVPATIAILDGVIRVGLDAAALAQLGRTGHAARKTSRRDVAAVVAAGGTGATTVSGTMFVASLVGIRVFVTGGIGGVHRGGEHTMDVSADITELGRTGVCVVCAGAKSLLDIGRTLEYLETQGVTVAGYGTDEFPAFFVPSSGHKAACRLDTPAEVARLVAANAALGMESGMVLGVPVPRGDAANGKQIEKAIQRALREADKKRISGKDITPFLLERVNQLTKGRSLKTNIALVKNNARVGAAVAVELAKLPPPARPIGAARLAPPTRVGPPQSDVVIVGGTALDSIGTPAAGGDGDKFALDKPGRVKLEWGGTGRNIADATHRLGLRPFFVSVVGRDMVGDMHVERMRARGMDVRGVARSDGHHTAVHGATLSEGGSLVSAVSDFAIMEELSPAMLAHHSDVMANARVVVVDGNVGVEALRDVVRVCARNGVDVWFEPTATAKAAVPVQARVLDKLAFVSPNVRELLVLSCAVRGEAYRGDSAEYDTSVKGVRKHAEVLLDAGVRNVLVTMGPDGVVLAQRTRRGKKSVLHFAARNSRVVNTNGAGDSFVAGVLWGVLRGGKTLPDAVQCGLHAAHLTVQSHLAVSPLLSPTMFR